MAGHGSRAPRRQPAAAVLGRAAAARLFSANVASDEPLAQRQATIALIRDRIGPFRDDPGRPPVHDTPAHCRWWLRGERVTVAVEILLTPEVPPRVQSLRLAVPLAPDGPLARVVADLLAYLNDRRPGWPASVAVARGVDTDVLARQFRMAAAWAGRCEAGAVAAGDGQGRVTLELHGEHARLLLAVAADPATGRLYQASLAWRATPGTCASQWAHVTMTVAAAGSRNRGLRC